MNRMSTDVMTASYTGSHVLDHHSKRKTACCGFFFRRLAMPDLLDSDPRRSQQLRVSDCRTDQSVVERKVRERKHLHVLNVVVQYPVPGSMAQTSTH